MSKTWTVAVSAIGGEPRESSNPRAIVTRGDQILVGRPHAGRNLLRDLEAALGVQPDPLQVADHDRDHVLARERRAGDAVEVLVERDLRRRDDDRLLRPDLLKRRPGAP